MPWFDPTTVPPSPAVVTTQPTSVKTKPPGSGNDSVTLKSPPMIPITNDFWSAPEVPGPEVVRLKLASKPFPPVVVKLNGPPPIPVVTFLTMIVGSLLLT